MTQRRKLHSLALLLLLSGCGPSVPDAVRLAPQEALSTVGLSEATHVLTGPAFVPPSLRGRAAMDRIPLTGALRQTVAEALAGLTRRTPWRKVKRPDVPIGPFFRYYKGRQPCGPWLMVFPYASRRRGPVWQLSAFRVNKAELEVMVFYATARPVDPTGGAAAGEQVSPQAEELFPLPRRPIEGSH